MKVCFVHTEGPYSAEEIPIHRALAKRMIASVKKHLACEVVQLTDPLTPLIDGVDAVYRLSPKGMAWIPYNLGLMSRQDGEVLFLDTDCVVQEDLRWVFNHDFDVALTFKQSRFAIYKDPEGVVHQLPSNGGVMFSRNPQFWADKKLIVEKMKDPMSLAWWGGGIALQEIIKDQRYKVLWLDAQRFNYTPNDEDEDLSKKAVVHYKGRHRKHWNLPGNWKPLPEERDLVVGAH